MKIRGQEVIEPKIRITRNIKITGGDCWEWQGAKQKGDVSYGRLTCGSRSDGTRKTVSAHRYSYEAFISEIPKGMWVLHKCDNPPCVNPDHLFIGDRQANVDDREMKGRNNIGGLKHSGETHPSAKLTLKQVISIRKHRSNYGWTQQKIADKFGVSRGTVKDILLKNTWATSPPITEKE